MISLSVSATHPYRVHLGKGLLDRVGQELLTIHQPCQVVIVSGVHVWPFYGKQVCKSLEESGFSLSSFLHEGGENAKSLSVYARLLDFLAEKQLRRQDLLVALGGGVTGDLCGFAAATYLRGMDYVQLPTTLLSMVDSSVGGKTALNLPAGKNLVGAFHSPLGVYADTNTLSTLPPLQIRSGVGEVVKTALLGDEALFSALEQGLSPTDESVIARSVAIKRDIVAKDEFDTSLRHQLNLGHSFAHALEKCSGYTLPHGLAVSTGLSIISRASNRQGLLANKDLERILSLLDKMGLPTKSDFPAQDILKATLADKKIHQQEITLVLPVSIGKCILRSVPLSELGSYLCE